MSYGTRDFPKQLWLKACTYHDPPPIICRFAAALPVRLVRVSCLDPFISSIEQWLGPGRCCPICHVPLPSQLLKLYYEPQKDSAQEAATSGAASVGACAGAGDIASPTSGSGAGESEPVSAEVTQLRRKVASCNKVKLSLACQRDFPAA